MPNQLNDLSFSFQRLSSCAHGFVSFDIISAPDRTAHGQCVNIPGQSQITKTVGMAVPPSLHHCARGLDIRVIEHFIRIREDHPSVEKMVVFLSFLLFKGTEAVTAGILTSGFSPWLIRSMRTGPSHWRARGHREITSSFLQVSQVFL